MIFRPTFLYIKRHVTTNKFYFGKTTLANPVNYKGSGSRWTRHIKKHGKEHVETLWYCLFTEQEELVKCAILCSTLWDIVKSENWMNLQVEDGLMEIVPGTKQSIEHIEKRVGHRRGKKIGPQSPEHREKRIAAIRASLKLKFAKL